MDVSALPLEELMLSHLELDEEVAWLGEGLEGVVALAWQSQVDAVGDSPGNRHLLLRHLGLDALAPAAGALDDDLASLAGGAGHLLHARLQEALPPAAHADLHLRARLALLPLTPRADTRPLELDLLLGAADGF